MTKNWEAESQILDELCVSKKLQDTMNWKISEIELFIIVLLFETIKFYGSFDNWKCINWLNFLLIKC